MNAVLSPPTPTLGYQRLVQAVALNQDSDALNLSLQPAQWEMLASYMTPATLISGQVLIQQGNNDRAVYLVESGSLSVHYEDAKGRIRLAIVSPGSVVGEGAFFANTPRRATVQSTSRTVVWSLAPMRFAELSNRQPMIALQLAMSLGAILSKRLASRSKRIAVT